MPYFSVSFPVFFHISCLAADFHLWVISVLQISVVISITSVYLRLTKIVQFVNIFTTISTVIYGKHVTVNEANSNVNTKRHLGNPDLFFTEFLISVFYILDYTLPNIILP